MFRYKLYFILLSILFSFPNYSQSEKDSLDKVITAITEDSLRVKKLNEISVYLEKFDPSLAVTYSKQAVSLVEASNNKLLKAATYLQMGSALLNYSEYSGSLDYFFKSFSIYQDIKDEKGMGEAYHRIGTNFYQSGTNYQKALEYFNKGLQIREKLGNEEDIADSYTNIGILYQLSLKDNSKALDYHGKALKIYKNINALDGIGAENNNIGLIYQELNLLPEALDYFKNANQIAIQLNNKNGISITNYNLGKVYSKMGKYAEAIELLTETKNISKSINDLAQVSAADKVLAECYFKMGNSRQAYESMLSALEGTEKAYEDAQLKKIAEMEALFEKEKSQKEIEILTKDKELQKEKAETESYRQRMIIWIIIGVLLVVLIISALGFVNYKNKQKANKLLEQAYFQIETKNKLITDSIDSAKTIQETILPSTDYVSQLFPQNFIFYQPKDIVSGDFYWLCENGTKNMLAVADCTGHGIPGAFMTFLGYNLLENTVKINKMYHPKTVLEKLNVEMQNIFKTNTEVKGGMDMALLAINKDGKLVSYSGAKNSVYIIRNKELFELKAGKAHIGVSSGKVADFKEHTFETQPGDMLYLFTDGYADQIGGDKKEKFFYQPFRDLLISISQLPADEQKQAVAETFNTWKGNREQTDDVLVVGIRL